MKAKGLKVKTICAEIKLVEANFRTSPDVPYYFNKLIKTTEQVLEEWCDSHPDAEIFSIQYIKEGTIGEEYKVFYKE